MIEGHYDGTVTLCGANSAEDGMHKLRAFQPDLTIVDIQMPVVDGLTMITQLQGEGVKSHFIILTGHDDFNYALQALRLRVFDYLLKPVDEQMLYALIDKLFKSMQNNISSHGTVPQKKLSANVKEV